MTVARRAKVGLIPRRQRYSFLPLMASVPVVSISTPSTRCFAIVSANAKDGMAASLLSLIADCRSHPRAVRYQMLEMPIATLEVRWLLPPWDSESISPSSMIRAKFYHLQHAFRTRCRLPPGAFLGHWCAMMRLYYFCVYASYYKLPRFAYRWSSWFL